MTIDYDNLVLKIIIPLASASIAIISLYISLKNTRRSIRVNKLEEILDIIFFLQIYYRPTFLLISDILHFRNEVNKGTVYSHLIDNIKVAKDTHKNKFDYKDIFDKMVRLNVLANAYLSNKNNDNLKMKIQFLIDLIIDMNRIIENEGNYIPEYIKNALPRSMESAELFKSIDSGILKEMGLGYKNLDWEKYKSFKQDYWSNLNKKSI